MSGAVRTPLSLSLDDLMRLPHITQKVDHFCVEGWNARAEWTGVRVADIARVAGIPDDIPDGRHAPFLLKPQAFNEKLSAFLRAVEAGAAHQERRPAQATLG